MVCDMVRFAVRRQDLPVLAEATTISARINEQLLPKPFFREMQEFAERTGIEGLMAAHSGTFLAFLLDPIGAAFLAKLDRARRFVEDLAPAGSMEVSNGQLLRETRWRTPPAALRVRSGPPLRLMRDDR